MTDERRQRILAIAEELESQGLTATNSSVYTRALGHRGHIVAVMKARRAERATAGGVAVIEEPEEEEDDCTDEPTETPAVVLANDLHELGEAYKGLHTSLEHIWGLEHEGTTDLATWNRKKWLEDLLTKNLQAQEQLRSQLEQARKREGAYAARDHHDGLIPEAREGAEQVLQMIADLGAGLDNLADVFQGQVDGFFAPRDAHGHQAFDVEDGATYVRRLVSALFPQDFRAPAMVDMLMQTPPREGNRRAALAACVRLRPFSETAIASYLDHAEGVSTNGQHS